MRAVLMIALAFAFGACVTRDRDTTIALTQPPQTSGAWRIEQRVDRVSGEPSPIAFVSTSRTHYSNRATDRSVSLQLTCFEKEPIIRFVFGHRIGSNKNSTLAYRFDEKPGRDLEATILPDYKTLLIDDKAEVLRFTDELAASKVLWVRVSSLFAGRSVAEFRVEGASLAIEAVTAECPLPKRSNRAAIRQ